LKCSKCRFEFLTRYQWSPSFSLLKIILLKFLFFDFYFMTNVATRFQNLTYQWLYHNRSRMGCSENFITRFQGSV
jgi:hypothetical protein